VLPQVLAGLGLELLSAGCLLWLQRLQPVFFVLALGALVYQGWLVRRRPPRPGNWKIRTVLAASLAVNVMMIAGWIVISVRYR
jgi:hypothetical protein